MTRMIDQEQWLVQLKPELFQFSTADPNAVSLSRLQQLIADRKANGFEANSYLIVFGSVFSTVCDTGHDIVSDPLYFWAFAIGVDGVALGDRHFGEFFFYLLNRFWDHLVWCINCHHFWVRFCRR